MGNELMIFEGMNLEVLTKEDVNFDFDGTVLFNGKQSCGILEYVNDRDAISKYVRNNQKYKVKNSDVVNHDFRKLNNAGETFITEKGIMKLIISSNMPKADDFEDKVWEIVTKVQKTGKFDSIEEKIKLIQDEQERGLTLKLYQLENVLKLSPNDMLTAINYNQTKMELDTYKQQRQLDEVNEKLKKIEDDNKKVADDIGLIKQQQVYICNRTNFNERMKIMANKLFGRDMQEAYKQLFSKMRLLGSFDILAHRKHEWEAINAERAKQNKKPYKPSTLKAKCNYLDVIDKFNKWELCSEAYKTIEVEMVS